MAITYNLNEKPVFISVAQPSPRPLVSIGIPVYNTPEPWLRKMMESVWAVASSYGNTEILIHDDGSTKPHVARVLSEFESKYGVILTWDGLNRGIAGARQVTVERARGKYYLSFDSDDYMPPFDLARSIALLERNPLAVYSWTQKYFFNENGLQFASGVPFYSPSTSSYRMNAMPNGAIIRMSALRAVGGYLPKFKSMTDDVQLFMKLSWQGPAMFDDGIPRCLARIRVDDTEFVKPPLLPEDNFEYAALLVQRYPEVVNGLKSGVLVDAPYWIVAGALGSIIFLEQHNTPACVELARLGLTKFADDPGLHFLYAVLERMVGDIPGFWRAIDNIWNLFSSKPLVIRSVIQEIAGIVSPGDPAASDQMLDRLNSSVPGANFNDGIIQESLREAMD